MNAKQSESSKKNSPASKSQPSETLPRANRLVLFWSSFAVTAITLITIGLNLPGFRNSSVSNEHQDVSVSNASEDQVETPSDSGSGVVAVREEAIMSPKDVPSPERSKETEQPLAAPITDASGTASNKSVDDSAENGLNTPWLKIPYATDSGMFSRETGAYFGSDGDRVYLFKREFFQGDTEAIVSSAKIPDGLSQLHLLKYQDQHVLLACGGLGKIHRFDPASLEILNSWQGYQRPEEEVRRTDSNSFTYDVIKSSPNPSYPYVFFQNSRFAINIPEYKAAGRVLDMRTFELSANEADTSPPESPKSQFPLAIPAAGKEDPFGRFSLVHPRKIIDNSVTFQLRRSPRAVGDNQPEQFDAELNFDPIAVVDRGRWIVGLSVAESPFSFIRNEASENPVYLCFASTLDFKTVHRVQIPNKVVVAPPNSAEMARRRPEDPLSCHTLWQGPTGDVRARILDSPDGNRFYLHVFGEGIAIPYDLPGLPVEPLLRTSRLHSSAIVGERCSLDLAPPDAGTKLSLLTAPDGMVADGNVIQWTPKHQDVGTEQVLVEWNNEEFVRKQVVNISVSHRALPWCGQKSGKLVVSNDGNVAAAVTWDEDFHHSSWISVLNLADGSVLSERVAPAAVKHLHLDSEHVSILHEVSYDDSVTVFDTKTLSPVATIKAEMTGMSCVAGRYLFPIHRSSNDTFIANAPIDLTQPEKPWPDTRGFPNWVTSRMLFMCFPLQGGVVLDGVFYRDSQLKDVRLLLEPAGILPAGNMQQRFDSFTQRSEFNVNPGGRRDDSSGLMYPEGSAPWEPGAVMLQLEKGSPKAGRLGEEDTLELAAFDAISKKEVYRWVIDRVPAKRTIRRGGAFGSSHVFPTRPNPRSSLAVVGNTAYVLSEGFIYPIALTEMGDRVATLRIVPEQLQFNLESGSRPTRLNYTIVGGKPPYTSELACLDVEPEISADVISRGGTPAEFRLDGARLLNEFKKTSYDKIVNNLRQIVPLETYNKDAGAYYEKLTGQKLKGVPFLVRLHLKVIDANNTEVGLSHGIVIEVALRELQFVLK